jgi:hypothetical protein
VIIDVKMKMQGSLGSYFCRGRRGRGRMVFEFITTCTISATNVEFESLLEFAQLLRLGDMCDLIS